MPAPHHWTECRPAVLPLDGATPEDTARTTQTIKIVWAKLSETDRLNFHRLCCRNIKNPATLATVEKIQDMFKRAAV